MSYKLSPIKITTPQKEWLKKEQQRTGNAMAAVIRSLIQEKVDLSEAIAPKGG